MSAIWFWRIIDLIAGLLIVAGALVHAVSREVLDV